MEKEQIVIGTIERISFHNPENGFTVVKLLQKGRKDLTTLVGTLPSLQPGETVQCCGVWKQDPLYGQQFVATSCQSKAPSDLVGIQKYLQSGLIKGIGPNYAKRIVDRFGVNTLEIIDQDPEKLSEVEGIGTKRKALIIRHWGEQKVIRDVMVFLQSYGVSPAYAQKIFRRYGQESIQRVTEDPYALAREIHGVGFKIADSIGQSLGYAKNSPMRIDGGIEYALSELMAEGHVCYPIAEFIPAAAALLGVLEEEVEGRLKALEEGQRIAIHPLPDPLGHPLPCLWLKVLFLCERGIAFELARIRHAPFRLRAIDTKKALLWAQEALSLSLAPQQEQAVMSALSDKLLVITGGPGTGKSTITKVILKIARHLTSSIVLAAPTGRAAKRMSEITHHKALTLHSLLEMDFKGGGFKRNKENPLVGDLFIIDESSMIDTWLMYHFLKAVPSHARVLFVGDVDQLPSVGPGSVLSDLIISNTLPVAKLTEIFRQAAGSKIITNAHRINEGTMPSLDNQKSRDFFFIEANTPEDVVREITTLVAKRLPEKYRLNPFEDIQVMAPMKKGLIGTENLNTVLQQVLNPKGHSFVRMGKTLRTGDKVMQTRNNYQKEVYNGDIGYITAIDEGEQELLVAFDGRDVPYDFNELDDLVLAYAVSVHKYQGSETPCAVICMHAAYYVMLRRNLLYTAVTRGKKLVVIVGSKQAIGTAVQNDQELKRYTGLAHWLSDIFSPKSPSQGPS